MIQITFLPYNINEEILFDIFRVYGKILEIKMNREYYQQVAAIIEYANQISANQAVIECRKLKIQNQYIQVCLCDEEDYEEFRTVNLFINNIPSDIKQDQLRIFFEQFGEVQLCKIKKLQFSKVSFSGVLEFKDCRTTIELMKIYLKQPLKVNGNIIIIQPFKEKSQTRDSIQILIQNFCRKLTAAEQNIPNIQRLIELSWELMIVEYYSRKNVKLKSCNVKFKLSETPKMLLVFPTLGETIKFMKYADQYQNHSCFQLGMDEISKLIKKYNFEQQVQKTFQAFQKLQIMNDDYFKGYFQNFNCRYCFNTLQNYDDRLLAIQGINYDINQNGLNEYISQFGLIRNIIFKEDKENKCQLCYALALTSYDANNIVTDLENKLLDQSKCLISDLGLKIQRFHYNHKDYDRILTELYEEIYHKQLVQTQIVKVTQQLSKDYFKNFDLILQNFDSFNLLNQIDQKYIIQQLIYEVVAQQSHLNLVDQKRIACIINNKYPKLDQILELQKNAEQLFLEIEKAENQIILDLHSDVIKIYSSVDNIMNNFQEFYALKEDQKINILKFLIIEYMQNDDTKIFKSQENGMVNICVKEVMRKYNFKVQDLLCLLEDRTELMRVLSNFKI